MTIFEELLMRIDKGEKFNIDFKSRSLKIGNQKIIDKGVYDNEKSLVDFNGNVLDMVEKLYHEYKYSMPSERSEKKRKCYFKALSSKDLTDEQMVFGERRETAQAKLEGFILCMILQNNFTWPDETKWFWQGKDEDLVILKDWIN